MLYEKNRGFSLLELLGVIAIIAVLLALVLPLSSSVSTSALRAKTKTQLSQYALALERYRQEYGHFPEFLEKAGPVAIQGMEVEHLIAALSLQELFDGFRAKRLQLNPKEIDFYHFSESELMRKEGKVVGIVDAQGEASIFILVDRDGRGVLRTGVPQALLESLSSPPSRELVASVLVFAEPKNGGRSVYFYE